MLASGLAPLHCPSQPGCWSVGGADAGPTTTAPGLNPRRWRELGCRGCAGGLGVERHLHLAGADLRDADVDLQAVLGLDDVAQSDVGCLVLAAGDGEREAAGGGVGSGVACASPSVGGWRRTRDQRIEPLQHAVFAC